MTLEYEIRGEGVPVVLLPGLTFDRTSWLPVAERLDARSTRRTSRSSPTRSPRPTALLPPQAVVEDQLGGGHFPQLADPDGFARRLQAFITP